MAFSKPWKPGILLPMSSVRLQCWSQQGALFALGFFALASQTLLLRTFLTVFEGHEFALGLFFCAWLSWIALGALCGRGRGMWLDKFAARFDLLLLLYVPAFLLQQTLLLQARGLTGVAAYEIFPWLPMLGIAGLANAPVSFVTGFLFTLACREPTLPVARVYVWEALGSAVGGVAITLWLAAGWAEESAFLICAAVLLLAIAPRRAMLGRGLLLFAAVLLVAAVWLGYGRAWLHAHDLMRWQRLLPTASFQGAFTTPQARYLCGSARGQFHVVAGESVVETLPNDEPASERIALLLAQQPQARRVLLIGPDALAMVRRLLLLPQIERVVWLHPDPAYPQHVLAALPSELRMNDTRFYAPVDDVRVHLQRDPEEFDAALLNVPDATTLVANRYLTEEFFRLLKTRLPTNGVVGVRVAGGENFLGGELVHLGASCFATLNRVFPRLAMKPGDESWFFASAAAPVSQDAWELGQRWMAIPGAEKIYPLEGLLAAMPGDRIRFQWRAYRAAVARLGAPALINTDDRPLALVFNLLLLGKQAGWNLPAQFLMEFGRAWLGPVSLWALLLVAALRLIFVRRPPGPRTVLATSAFEPCLLLFNTGLVGMATSLLLMALYQFRFGALFLHVGLIAALFMLGLTLGGCGGAALSGRWPERVRGLLLLTLLAHLGLLLAVAQWCGVFTTHSFWGLFFLAGCFQGLYVPLAVARLQSGGATATASGAAVESLDNLGGAMGGLLAGIVLLPLLGISGTLYLLLGFVALNFLAVVPRAQTRPIPAQSDAADRMMRRIGYVVVGLLLWWLVAAWYARHLQEVRTRSQATDASELTALAHELAPDAKIEPQLLAAPDGVERPFLILHRSEQVSYLVNSDLLAKPVNGYGGAIRFALLLRADGTLTDFRLIHSHETPSYVQRIAPWLEKFKTRSLTSSNALAHVDAVSGATYTTRAILQTLRQAGPAFAEKILYQPPAGRASASSALFWCDGLLGVVLLVPLILRWWPRRTLAAVRWLWLAIVLGFVGFHLNAQYSLHHLALLLRGELPPPALSTPFLLAVAVPLLVALFGNYYCGWLCPFGAAQEFARLLWPRRWQLDPRKHVWRWTRWLKFALLAAAALAIGLGLAEPVQRADPLATIFSGFAEKPILFLAVAVLIASIFFGRFWCRNLCPTGAFLGWLGAWRPFHRLAPQTAPGLCDYGVRHHRDLDCLQCDRCRRAVAVPNRESSAKRLLSREWVFLLLVAMVLGVVVREFPSLGKTGAFGFQALEKSASGGKLKPTDPAAMKKITEQIRQKKLSDHAAKYYKRITEP
ncbi:MAG: 4Fe-4S binding protein [Verrucomicrobia bacterium]|nr:MAG: 4Fe-4S binding protein [Verrucomicrobiota bacterium]